MLRGSGAVHVARRTGIVTLLGPQSCRDTVLDSALPSLHPQHKMVRLQRTSLNQGRHALLFAATLVQAWLPNLFSCKALMDSAKTKFSPIPQTKISPTTILVSQVEIGEIATECPENLQCVRSMRGMISVDVPGRHSRALLGQRRELHTIGCHVARSHGCRSLICQRTVDLLPRRRSSRRRDQPAAWTGGRRRTRP